MKDSFMREETHAPAGQTLLSNEEWVCLPAWQRKILQENMTKQALSESIVRSPLKPLVNRHDCGVDLRKASYAIDDTRPSGGNDGIFSVINLVRGAIITSCFLCIECYYASYITITISYELSAL